MSRRNRLHVVRAVTYYGEPTFRLEIECPYGSGPEDIDAPCAMWDLECVESTHCAHRPYDPDDEFKWDDVDFREHCPRYVDDIEGGHCGVIHHLDNAGMDGVRIEDPKNWKDTVSFPFAADVHWESNEYPVLTPVAEIHWT